MSLFKNEVGRPSNEIIRKRNIFKGICVLLVLVIIGLVGYILNDKGIITINNTKNNNKKNNSEVTTTTKQNNVLETEALAKELFNDMNSLTTSLDVLSNDRNLDYWSYFYTFDKINKKSVDNNIKLALAFRKYFVDSFGLASGDIEKQNEIEQKILKQEVDSSIINEKYKVLFGENIDDYNINAEVLGFSIKYNSDKKKYSFTGTEIGDASSAMVLTKITDTKIESDRIEVYNKALFVAGSIIYGDVNVYKDVKLDDFSKQKYQCENFEIPNCYYGVLNKIDSIDVSKISYFEDISIDNYINKLNTYKWIFTKNSEGNYVFTSVEKIK